MKFLIFIIVFISSAAIAQNNTGLETSAENKHLSSAGLIERAFYNKEIKLDQRIQYLIYYLNDYTKLPKKFKSSAPEKCGTWIVQIINNNYYKLSNETKQTLKSYGFTVLE